MARLRFDQPQDGAAAGRFPAAGFTYEAERLALVDGKPELLSTFQYIYEALGITSDEEDEFRSKKLVL